MSTDFADPQPDYWADYNNLQRIKHELIRSYLGGWFPKLAKWSGRILYVDTHAGRGKHTTGHLGSPLVALRTLLEHSHRDQILRNSEAKFIFIERDKENLASLQKEIASLGPLPPKVDVIPICDDAFAYVSGILDGLSKSKGQLAPAFVFIDPYGFKAPGNIFKQLLSHSKVEIFINIIWRELDMGIVSEKARTTPTAMSQTLDRIFDGDSWRTKVTANDPNERAAQAIKIFEDMTGAKWATYIRMLGKNTATRYLLLHLSNHDDGRDLMKDCIWKCCPEGEFYAWQSTNFAQQTLLTAEPDLKPLRLWTLQNLEGTGLHWEALVEKLRETLWRATHLNSVLRDLKKESAISFVGEKFARTANPLLRVKK
jgi:three-Cys-motif partner protein